MTNPKISLLTSPPVWEHPFEIVERKGIGHPDTICDALAEQLSTLLCKEYKEKFGLVLHHNVDKGLLFAGKSEPRFKGGRIIEPMEIFLVGRATTSFKETEIPVQELAIEGTRAWFKRHFHAIDPYKHLKIHCLIRPGSSDLTELYLRQAKTGIPLANDTSCGVGYAPMDELEQVVYHLEKFLNDRTFKESHPAYGQDIKIMGVRSDSSMDLTVACAFVDRFVSSLSEYLEQKKRLAEMIKKQAEGLTKLSVQVKVNAADEPEAQSVYLTVTGTSGEAGDDGEVGRGNRVNGLITPFRPMNMEAAAGKNPITHVGKIYNIMAMAMARRIVKELPEVQEVYCYLVSQIGQPIDQPKGSWIRLRLPDNSLLQDLEAKVKDIYHEELSRLKELWHLLLEGKITIY